MINTSNVKGQMSNVILGIRTDTANASIILAFSSSLSSSTGSDSAPDRGSSSQDSASINIIDRTDWLAGRQLAATVLAKIDELFQRNQKTWQDLSGIVVYEGPGSFTGLRIGLTVANTAAFTLDLPIIGATGDDWLEHGVKQIAVNHFTRIVIPHYGAEPNITKPKV